MFEISPTVIDYLLEGPPWVQYNTRLYLLGETSRQKTASLAYTRMARHPQIASMLKELETWPGKSLKRHDDADLLIHKLVFLADIGINRYDTHFDTIFDAIMNFSPEDGPFTVRASIPLAFGGSGRPEKLWMLCDASLITYSLLKMGFADHPRVIESGQALLSLRISGGWTCESSKEGFCGPGKKGELCPYASLLMLRILSLKPCEKYDAFATETVESMLELWRNRSVSRPFLFGMGSEFAKLKQPAIWYDVLHMMDVLRCFPEFNQRNEMREMSELIKNQMLDDGTFKAGSVWKAWKEFDFGQKKESSAWITFKAYHILQSLSRN